MLQDNVEPLGTYEIAGSNGNEEKDIEDINVNYETGSFDDVKAVGDSPHTPIWLGKVLSIVSNENENVSKLHVNCIDERSPAQRLYRQYMPLFYSDGV